MSFLVIRLRKLVHDSGGVKYRHVLVRRYVRSPCSVKLCKSSRITHVLCYQPGSCTGKRYYNASEHKAKATLS